MYCQIKLSNGKDISAMTYLNPEKIMPAPLTRFSNQDVCIELNCHGNKEFTKVSYPVKYGLFSRLETQDYLFEFNLNHEIRHAKSKIKTWIHPSEWLKRTIGNEIRKS